MDTPGTITNDTYQQWADFVECPICYTVYDRPMQMGCGHTFCSTCIGRLVERVKTSGATEIKCPECRKPTTVPVNGLPEILAQGVYFDCSQCEEKGSKICPMCAIRLHNGHIMVEEKTLTSDDVRVMKQKINEASTRAVEALKNIKPQFESVGGSVEKKVVENFESFVKIFDFMVNSFDSKIKDTSTMDELMVEVKKAERVAETYEKGRKTDELMAAIKRAVEEYLKPFEVCLSRFGIWPSFFDFQKLKKELDFQPDIPDIAAAPAPAPPPARVIYAPQPPPQQPLIFPPYQVQPQLLPGHPHARRQVLYPGNMVFSPGYHQQPGPPIMQPGPQRMPQGQRNVPTLQLQLPQPQQQQLQQQQFPQQLQQQLHPQQLQPPQQPLQPQQFQQQQAAQKPHMPEPRGHGPEEPSTSSNTSATQPSTSDSQTSQDSTNSLTAAKRMKMVEPEPMDADEMADPTSCCF
ncbi:hypothetical protein CRE_23478 [Caenorhabditis remanei]|uniref:RING-type domain-containing protein n=1 Tax=Caenorhabditis remanei TaxID=31234 RepID=E3MGX5_CAERE|nr:hypothetical protein CRE_23478 [Caenorhabditis remanei]